jgi:hypothetical protein
MTHRNFRVDAVLLYGSLSGATRSNMIRERVARTQQIQDLAWLVSHIRLSAEFRHIPDSSGLRFDRGWMSASAQTSNTNAQSITCYLWSFKRSTASWKPAKSSNRQSKWELQRRRSLPRRSTRDTRLCRFQPDLGRLTAVCIFHSSSSKVPMRC